MRIFVVLILLFLAVPSLFAHPNILRVSGNEEAVFLSPFMEVAEVENLNLESAEKVVENIGNLKFSKIEGESFHRGYYKDKKQLLFRFKLENNTADSKTYYFEVPYANIDSIQFFELGLSGSKKSNLSGTCFPFSKREIANKNFVYEIRLPANQTKQFYLFVGKPHSELFLPFTLHSTTNFLTKSSFQILFEGVFTGIFMLVIAVAFTYSFKNPQPMHLAFSVMMFAILVFHLADSGLGFQYFWGDSPWFQQRARSLGSFVSQVAFVCFTIFYFGMHKHKKMKLVFWSSNFLIICYSILIIHSLLMDIGFLDFMPSRDFFVKSFLLVLMLIIPWGFYVIVQAWKTQQKRSLPFYSVAFVLPAFACVVLALRNSEILEANFFINNFLRFSHIATFISLTLAMVERVRNMKRQKEKLELQNHELLVQQSEHQIELLNATTNAIMEERSQLANNLHDGLGAMLVAIRHNFSSISTLFGKENKMAYQNVKRLLDEAYQETRQLSHGMQTDKVQDIGLLLSLQEMICQLESPNMKVKFWHHGLDEEELTPMQAHNCYRIIQELVTNIIKHAKANSLIINIAKCSKQINITVEDNGIGFIIENSLENDGIGLKSTKNRIELMGGSIDFQSEMNEGTSIFMEIPILDSPIEHYTPVASETV